MKENSAGGVVVKDGKVLLLRKYFGDWVLPKGKIEKEETTSITALREVKEETGVNAEIIKRIGFAKYIYYNQASTKVFKRVDYYLMNYKDGEPTPQKEEGFAVAEFHDYEKAIGLLKHESERKMVENAIKLLRKRDGL